jgi:ABC-type antimicrobial peptide transport system permease subunit
MQDHSGAARVAVVNESAARALFGSTSAMGGRLIMQSDDPAVFEVVGVVKDMPQQSLTSSPKTVIFPALVRNATASFVIRSERAGTASLLSDVERAMRSVNAGLAPANAQTLGEMYRQSMARTSMMLLVLAITGTVALLLGLVGVYGIVSYAVAQRRREIGIRLALGAAQRDVRLRFVRQALVLVAIGVAVGLGAATGLTRLMTSQLFGVSPLDPPTHVTVALMLLTTAGLASFVSAQRASAVDPVEVLKG